MLQHQYISTINNPAFLSLTGSVDSMYFVYIQYSGLYWGYVQYIVYSCIPTVFLNTRHVI